MLDTVSHWSKLTLRLIDNGLGIWSERGVVVEFKANTARENLNRGFEMLTFQQASNFCSEVDYVSRLQEQNDK